MPKVKVKIAADAGTAAALRSLVGKVVAAELARTPEEVQAMAWLLVLSREIALASAETLSLEERGHEMVLSR